MGVTPPRIPVGHRESGSTALSPFVLAAGRGAPRWGTRVEAAWDEACLRVAFECRDDDAWGSFVTRDEPLWQQEVVELFLAAGEAVPVEYFEFEVSPTGVLFDARVANPHGDRMGMVVDSAWNCPGIEWSAAPTGEHDDWRAELVIPWRGLGHAAAPRVLRANFYRIERPRGAAPEFSCWSPTYTSPADFHRPRQFGVLDLIR